MSELITQFHFLRPMWLLMLLPGLLLTALIWRQHQESGSWNKVIAPELLSHLIKGQAIQQQRWPIALLATAWILASIALAGPSWQKITTPVSKSQQPLVIVTDLSYKQYTADLSPNRLTRLRYKLLDLFRLRNDGLTAVVAFAGGAHAVSPLTDDNNTLANLVPALSPDIMPEQGQNPLSGIELAIKLLAQGANESGDILLITDDIPRNQSADIEALIKQSGHRLSVLGVGSEQGAPISLPGGGYLKDNQGTIVVPKLNKRVLQALAQSTNGQYRDISLDNSDLIALLPKPGASDTVVKVERQFDLWHDAGYWLVLLLLPIALPGFRKGWLMLLLVAVTALPGEKAMAFEWSSLWKNSDQRGAEALINKDPASATELFRNPDWKAEAFYQNKQFEEAARLFADSKTAGGYYNQGNALAKAGKLDDAIAAYEKALELNPAMNDATFNKKVLEKLKQEQEQQKQDQKDQPSGKDQQSGKNQQQDQQGQENQQSGNNQQQSQQDSGEKNQSPQDQEQQKKDQPQQSQQSTESQQRQEEEQQPSRAQQQQQQENAEQQEQEQSLMEQDQDEQDAPTPDQQAVENWLNTIPDDPGGLLRRKFLHQQQLRQESRQQERAW